MQLRCAVRANVDAYPAARHGEGSGAIARRLKRCRKTIEYVEDRHWPIGGFNPHKGLGAINRSGQRQIIRGQNRRLTRVARIAYRPVCAFDKGGFARRVAAEQGLSPIVGGIGKPNKAFAQLHHLGADRLAVNMCVGVVGGLNGQFIGPNKNVLDTFKDRVRQPKAGLCRAEIVREPLDVRLHFLDRREPCSRNWVLRGAQILFAACDLFLIGVGLFGQPGNAPDGLVVERLGADRHLRLRLRDRVEQGIEKIAGGAQHTRQRLVGLLLFQQARRLVVEIDA